MSKRLAVCLVLICGLLFRASAQENPDDELSEILREFVTATNEYKTGLDKVETGLNKVEAGLNKVEKGLQKQEKGLETVERASAGQSERLNDLGLSFADHAELTSRTIAALSWLTGILAVGFGVTLVIAIVK